MPCTRIPNGFVCSPTIFWIHYAGTDYEVAKLPYCGVDIRSGPNHYRAKALREGFEPPEPVWELIEEKLSELGK